MKKDYSEKEFAMIAELSPNWADIITRGVDGIFPPVVLETVGIDCFINNKQGKAVESLRRCLKAIHDCNPYRRTPEYENLIQL